MWITIPPHWGVMNAFEREMAPAQKVKLSLQSMMSARSRTRVRFDVHRTMRYRGDVEDEIEDGFLSNGRSCRFVESSIYARSRADSHD